MHDGIYRVKMASTLKDSRIAVDTPIYLSKCMYSYLPKYLDQMPDEEIRNFRRFDPGQTAEICGSIVDIFMDVFKNYTRITEASFVMIIEGMGKPSIKDRFAGERRKVAAERHRERFEEFVVQGRMREARRMLSNLNLITLDVLSEHLVRALDKVGVKYVTAPGESERFACELRMRDEVDHILTTDTDCLAMSQSFINDIDVRNGVYTLIDHDAILDALSLTPEEFTDLCIMCGCDYNDNIPRVGVMKAYKLITEHRSIETLKPIYNIDCLNHTTCRSLFAIE